MTQSARLTDTVAINNFVRGGNATFTLVSNRTGTRYTYKSKKSDKTENLFFASVMYGPDNVNDFVYIGAFGSGPLRITKRSKVSQDDVRFRALGWFLNKLDTKDLGNDVEFWHEGRCACCGRKLTVPSSIETGIGPECAKRHFGG